ncbi:haloacid dehalogenase [Labrys miyagiensis]|uniref:Haloacid dehalogenase n=1 Tax=Labrys miyagiensis TaxID=346912 RepID=A0ABQ6CFP6_9HYPH|nr:HAD family hydrolase [Labrys miyagiensis]GLS19093.1 haloacid dehalogenase [Labrys miyagiensis]
MATVLPHLTTIGFDADDTLWQSEQYFGIAHEEFVGLLADFADREALLAHLLETGMRNVRSHGFGMKTFTFSMIETAIEISGGKVPAHTIGRILAIGKEILSHPVELLPGAGETVEKLAGSYRLVLITKGDLFHQESKVEQSGLKGMFEAVEIVSEKSADTYARAFSRHGDGPASSMMIGNSLKSDVIPALQVGSWGVYVPHHLTWVYEHAEAPLHEPRFREIEGLVELPALLEALK